MTQILKSLRPLRPYASTGLLPTFSPANLRMHFEDIQDEHVAKVDELTQGTPLANLPSLEELVRVTRADQSLQLLHGHASELWNHIFFFDTLCPKRKQPPMSPFMEDLIFTHFQGPDRLYWLVCET